MSMMEFDTPDQGREDSQSALDFAFWMLSYASDSYGKSTVFTIHEGAVESGDGMLQALAFALEQVNIPMPTENISVFRSRCLPYRISFDTAIRVRGALLFKGESVVMAVGDGKRVMEYYSEEYVTRFLTDTERTEEFWVCTRIPEMIYL